METMGNWQIIATDSITKIKLKRLHESAKTKNDIYQNTKTENISIFKTKYKCKMCNVIFYKRRNDHIIKSEIINDEKSIVNKDACTSCHFILELDLLDIKPNTQRKNELCSNFLTNLVEEKCPKILQKGTLIYYCTGCFESFPTELEKSTHFKTHN